MFKYDRPRFKSYTRYVYRQIYLHRATNQLFILTLYCIQIQLYSNTIKEEKINKHIKT